MVWSLENSRNDEAAKIRWEVVPYFHGRVLDIGCGAYKTFPHWIGVDNGHHWGMRGVDVKCEATKLDLFASQSVDAVFSSHLLEHIPYELVPQALAEWYRVVKPGGHIILYLPDEDEYPKCGTQYANSDHRWNVNYQRVVDAMDQVPCSWDLVQYEKRNQNDEYSLYFVFQKLHGRVRRFSYRDPKPEKTCAIVRYGAIGDMVQVSSLFPALKDQGYHLTVYCQDGQGYEAIKHDPHVDRFIIQGKDEIPPQFLDEFWAYTKPKYTKWINLCESVEATLLASPGRANWEWPNELRAKYLDRNYLEWTHELAQVPPPYRPKFYSTLEEKAWARRTAQRWGRTILWSLAGSSGHKVWPHLDPVIDWVLREYDDVHVILVGDELARILQSGWDRKEGDRWVDVHPRVHCRSGIWSIRESMAFAEVADLIIGTETGLLNAAGLMDAWKIVTLSHSSKEMLTKHWKNVITLEQPKGVGCNKHPCRQLHGANNTSPWQDCPQEETTGTALCQFHIGPEMMIQAIKSALDKQRMAA